MEKYNYLHAMTNDIKDWIREETNFADDETLNRDQLCEGLWDELFAIDEITGNGYNYYAGEDKCSEYLTNNFDLLYEAVKEYNPDDNVISLIEHYEEEDLARYFDCTIRCYLLMEAINQAIDELAAEGFLKI